MTKCYCIALRKAARRVSATYDEALAPVGINIAQFSMLRNVERNQPVSLTELGKLCELDRSTVGRNARVLERMGLIESVPGRDHREATVALSKDGARVLKRGAPLWDRAQAKIEAALGPSGADQLNALLGAV